MRVFLDIGGYKGHSSLAALDPIFGFDRVFCFEPVALLADRIRQINDPRLVVVEAALSDFDGRAPLYHAGTLAGSLFEDAPQYLEDGTIQSIQVLNATTTLRSIIGDSDFVRTKFNCEGSEVDILEALMKNWERTKIVQVIGGALIDFDANKIPSKRVLTASIVRRLSELGVAYLTPPECQYGMVTNYGGVRNYLLISGARVFGARYAVKSLFYNIKMFSNPEINGYHKMRLLRRFPFLKRFAKSAHAVEDLAVVEKHQHP